MSSELQNKMYNYEVQPPATGWNRVVAALDEESDSLAQRLQNFETSPPPTVWNKIKEELGNEKEIVPFRKKNVFRYAAAAVLVALMVLSGSLLLKNNNDGNDTVSQPKLTNSNSTVNSSSSITTPDLASDKINSFQAQGAADKQIAYQRPKRNSVFTSHLGTKQMNAPERIEVEKRISFGNTIDRYMVYSDGHGNAMRLPKKLYDVISCIQVDISCKDRMQGYQQKIANAALTSDFTAVLEMLNNLRENQ